MTTFAERAQAEAIKRRQDFAQRRVEEARIGGGLWGRIDALYGADARNSRESREKKAGRAIAQDASLSPSLDGAPRKSE